jgi:tetrahydromethanopterin S-methyltransferase subunit G
MKYLFSTIIILLLAVSVHAQNDAISKYFDQYLDDDNFTVVYVSGKMFDMIAKVDIDELEDEEAQIIMDVAKDIKGLRVLVTDVDPKQYYKQARKLVKSNDGYEVLLTVRDKGDNVNFWIKEKDNVIEELFLLVGSEDEFVMVSFLGQLDLNKIAQLADKIEMSGAEHLQKIGKSIEKDVGKSSN